MRMAIRIVSGFFMAAIGAGFWLETRYLDSVLLKALLAALGTGSIGLGLFVLVKKPKRNRAAGGEGGESGRCPGDR